MNNRLNIVDPFGKRTVRRGLRCDEMSWPIWRLFRLVRDCFG